MRNSVRKEFGCVLMLLIFTFYVSHSQDLDGLGDQSISALETQVSKYEKEGNLLELARYQSSLGYLYKEKNDINKSVEYFQKAIKTNERLGNINAVKNICSNLGLMYAVIDNYEQAVLYFQKSLKISEKQGKKPDVLSGLINIGQVQQNLKNYTESNQNLERGVSIALELSDKVSLKNCYLILSENYDKLGNQNKAKEYFDLAASLKSQMQKEEIRLYEMRTKHAEAEVSVKDKEMLEQKLVSDKEMSVKDKEIKSKDSKIEKLSREQQLEKELRVHRDKEFQEHKRYTRNIIAFLGVILTIVISSLIFIFKQLRAKKKAYSMLEQSNLRILEQKREIEKQRDIVTNQKKKITDSIHYAQRIQNAVLPPALKLEKIFPEYFILYRPRDIVSGDFYWISEKDGILIIAAADCTGHGVPGAFMSMLGVAFLNEIVNKITFNKHIRSLNANEVLNQLRENIINSLHQSGKPTENKDGMDIALCIIDFENRQMQYAGAHNPLYIIRDGELKQIDADAMPIGVYKSADRSFTNHEISLEKDDLIYIFSDGYYDQLGGEKGFKIFSTNFRKQLLQIHYHSLLEQKKLLEEYYDNWRGEREQVDDVLVIGFKFVPRSASAPRPQYLWQGKRILIAEDVENNYLFLAEALKPTKAEIIRVVNGQEAVDFCKNNAVDLVLMDIYMPVMDGLEATRQIRTFNSHLQIIAQTANSKSDDMSRIKEAGCNGYISKPIKLALFLELIHKHLTGIA